MGKRNAHNPDSARSHDDRIVYLNMDYLLSCPAVFKILECIFLIAAMACMVQYEAHWVGYPAKVIFFYIVVCVSWILCLSFFIMLLCTCDKRMPDYDWSLCIVFTSTLIAIFVFASAGLMADEARRHQNLGWKDVLSTKINFHLDHLVAAVVLAFIAALIFIIDAIVHLIRFFQERKRRRQYKARTGQY
ncbi:uncharacterized protein LOC116303974 [Actinia tenebrosa]|uniref:Uncharacterized protein LOC116303974 n=1 Tax=Actinia tenebrosa TaxID=6105 RepID=A0A6P8IQV8_ACTTE|nr:uncharacterized protein LOC116303974 [Actinia tenebrosa]XP_031569472.1 uncharacterized protein LOC116303974 [Actinia tenebrosa]